MCFLLGGAGHKVSKVDRAQSLRRIVTVNNMYMCIHIIQAYTYSPLLKNTVSFSPTRGLHRNKENFRNNLNVDKKWNLYLMQTIR